MPTKTKKPATRNKKVVKRSKIHKNLKIIFALIVSAGFGLVGLYYLTGSNALVATYPNFETEVVAGINRERGNRGLKKLTHTVCFHNRALDYARELANQDKFLHNNLDEYFVRCPNGDKPRYVGEVLARGFSTPQGVVQGWMNSDGHRRVIMSTSPNTIGVGVAKNSSGAYVVVGLTAKCDNGPCGATYSP